MNRPRSILLVGLALGMLIRVSLIFVAQAHPDRVRANDSPTYIEPAKFILSDGYYSYPSAIRTPGYPYFISFIYLLAGPDPAAVSAAQGILGIITLLLTFQIGRILASEDVAWVGVVLLALGLESIASTFFVLSETLFTLILAASLLCLLQFFRADRLAWAIAAGIFAGLAILTRPAALFFPLLTVLLFVSHQTLPWSRRIRVFAVYLISAILITVPWVVRNQRLLGIPMVSTISSYNLLAYNAASLVADQQGIPIAEARQLLSEQQDKALAEAGLADTEANRARIQGRLARRIILAAPFRYLVLHIREDLKGFLPGTGYLSEIMGRPAKHSDLWEVIHSKGLAAAWAAFIREQAWLPLVVLPFVILLIAIYADSIIGAAQLLRERKVFTFLFLVLPIFYFLLLPGAPSNSRFRIPVMPYFDLLAAYGIMALYRMMQARYIK